MVEGESKLVAFSIAEPADARRKTLELNFFLGHGDPTFQVFVLREHFEDQLIGARDVRTFSGKCRPAERTFAFAEQGANVGRNKAGKIISLFHSSFVSESADVVAVVEGDRTEFMQIEHALDVLAHGGDGVLAIFQRVGFAKFKRLVECHSIGDVTANGIVGAGLIRQYVRHNTTLGEFGDYVGAVADQTYGSGFAFTY